MSPCDPAGKRLAPSHAAGFGLRMMGQPTKPKEAGVFRGVAPAIGLFVGLLPAMAQAQTNIDQGKSPAEIFANDCATCHKSARGLANGRGSSGLASFLVEHYTASKDQAAALAAYVMGAGGGEAGTGGPRAEADFRSRPQQSCRRTCGPAIAAGGKARARCRLRAGRPGPQPASRSAGTAAMSRRQPRPRNSLRRSSRSRPRRARPRRKARLRFQARARPRRRIPMPAKTRRCRATIFRLKEVLSTEERLA